MMKTKMNAMMALAAALAVAWPGAIMAGNSPTLSVSMVPNITVTGDAGTYTLQYASVLGGQTNWVTLTNLTLTGTTTNWLDYSGVGQAQRYYRTVTLTTSTNPNPDLLVWIPAGTFVMGSPTTEALRYSNETQHTVTLTKGFYMSKYLVTQAEYALACLGANQVILVGPTIRWSRSLGMTQTTTVRC
jgi:formylglycine-generating enzyme required for sulfatase activity